MNVSSLNATIYVANLTFSIGAPAAGATGAQDGQNVAAVFNDLHDALTN